VNGKDYKTFTLNGSYIESQMVEIQYNPDNRSDIRSLAPQNKTIGIWLIVIGLIIMMGTIHFNIEIQDCCRRNWCIYSGRLDNKRYN
jgi:hypothetical protein